MVSAIASAARISRRVAVIGGGSGGVVAARYLKKAGHQPRIFEAGDSFGGVWAERPTNDVVYKNLQTNLPTVVMQSPDLDFAPGLPSYIDKRMLGQYIERYANFFGVASLTTFGARVTHVAPAEPDTAAGDATWKVEWQADGITHAEVFDAVVVANGHYEAPYMPTLPGEAEWLAADGTRSIVHSRDYEEPEAFDGRSVLVVGGRSSGVDITRMLRGHAKWVYILEKKCTAPVMHADEAVTHVPLGTRLCRDGRLRVFAEAGAKATVDDDGAFVIDGPPVETVILATGYVYSFPFMEEAAVGMKYEGLRHVTPLYQHVLHARRPTLGFVGINLAVPCPIPFFECQSNLLAEHWAHPSSGPGALTSADEREAWVAARIQAVGERIQDLHFTSAGGGDPWQHMRELVRLVHAVRPPAADGESWLDRPDWEHRLSTVQSVYNDRAARYPKLPWEDDSYRRCEYAVDWETGQWTVDDSEARASTARAPLRTRSTCPADA